MEFSLRHQLSTQVRLHIYTYFLIYIIVAVSGERTLYPTESDNSRDFKTLWDVYILPHLEHDLNSKYEHAIETNVEEDNYSDMPEQSNILHIANEERQKREHIDVAGLGTVDHMASILDRMKTTPLKTGFGFSRLQQLMRQNGRKRR